MRRFGGILFAALLAASGFVGCEDNPVTPPQPGPEPDSQGLPYVVIDWPPAAPLEQQYAKIVRFTWHSGGASWPVAIRYLCSLVIDTNGTYSPTFDIIKDLNENPARYDTAWSRWISTGAPGDSGTSATIGDDETLEFAKSYVFAVQARDKDGRVTEVFSTNTNARRFRPTSAFPLLLIYDEYLIGFRFIGTNPRAQVRDIPPGIPLRIRWQADVSSYSGEVAGYRYAWDLPDPSAWDEPFRLDCTEAGEVTFYGGVHTLFIQAADIAGAHVLARITLNIVPLPMDRNLLFVDGYYSTNMPVPDYSNPTESAHDAFWLTLLSRADGFDPVLDVYDCTTNSAPLSLDLISRYKNIIWTYSVLNQAWVTMVTYIPESDVGKASEHPMNYLAMFLLRGGHVWTLGQSQDSGGLAAALSRKARVFPMSLECEIAGNRNDCRGDRGGVRTMAYRDYCVSVLDKVDGLFRNDPRMPARKRNHYDCMSYGLRADSDPLTAAHPDLPARLDLWEEVTKSGRFFNPDDSLGPGGFTYVEIYDPAYWMTASGLFSQPCFHPMYRMRAKSGESALNDCAIAIWMNKYAHVVPDVSSGAAVAAPSVHFGFPLWFFKRSAVDSIATAIFDEWGILKQQ